MAACETTANASERPPTYCTALQAHSLAGIAQRSLGMERVMGIEYIAGGMLIDTIHSVASGDWRCG
jgi:hypothetical protein